MPKKSLDEAIEAAADQLIAMSESEFKALMDEEDRLMKNAIINGGDHLGLQIWYMQSPEECQKYVNEVMEEHEKSLK